LLHPTPLCEAALLSRCCDPDHMFPSGGAFFFPGRGKPPLQHAILPSEDALHMFCFFLSRSLESPGSPPPPHDRSQKTVMCASLFRVEVDSPEFSATLQVFLALVNTICSIGPPDTRICVLLVKTSFSPPLSFRLPPAPVVCRRPPSM